MPTAREQIMQKLGLSADQFMAQLEERAKKHGSSRTAEMLAWHKELFSGEKPQQQERLVPRGVDLEPEPAPGGFTKAKKSRGKHRVAIAGPSGSGKTMSALVLAKEFGQKIALVDTEYHSAELYADIYDFDVMLLDAPFGVEKYVTALDQAIAAKYDTIIFDSITPMWDGEGGLLELKDRMIGRGKNSFTAWGDITPLYKKFIYHMLESPIHVISTVRAKQEYAMSTHDGKPTVQKLGMGMIQRPGMEYEYTVVFDMDMQHNAIASKDRTNMFSSTIPFPMDGNVGKRLMKWLEGK
jgi:hypothetical protein